MKRSWWIVLASLCLAIPVGAFAQAPVKYTLMVMSSGTGRGYIYSSPGGLVDCAVNAGWSCANWFDAGTTVTLKVVPSAGSVFVAWSGDCAGTNPECAVTIDRHKTVNATVNVAPGTKRVHVGVFSADGIGAGRIVSSPAGIDCGRLEGSCDVIFPADSAVVLTPEPDANSVFTEWSGACSGTGTCTLSTAQSSNAYAEFSVASPATLNFTGLYWVPAESGWGINLSHQGDILFATLFTYDAKGAPMWLVMSAGRRLSQSNFFFQGDLFVTKGPPFNAVPFTPISSADVTKVGRMSLSFSAIDVATLQYTVDNISVSKRISKQVYGSRAAHCVSSNASRSASGNYQDLWWNSSESGWGLNITHQDETLFATLFTYDAAGHDLWLVMSAGQRQADGSYAGDLFRTKGPPYNANPFTPIGNADITKVGTMTLRFHDGNAGTLNYTYEGAAVTKTVTRQVFSVLPPICD